jgi:hypothetical protein
MRIWSGKSAATFCVETPIEPVVPSNTTFFGFIKATEHTFPPCHAQALPWSRRARLGLPVAEA